MKRTCVVNVSSIPKRDFILLDISVPLKWDELNN